MTLPEASGVTSNGLALAASVSATSLELPSSLSFEDWERTGETLGKIDKGCRWWIGDWLNFGERRYGETYAQAMEATGLEYNTLSTYAWVCREVESSRRREHLSFSHHLEVAGLDPPEQRVLLEEAEREGWSVHRLRREIKGVAEEAEVERCPTCGHRLGAGSQIRPSRRKARS
jgi:hypothetical protein